MINTTEENGKKMDGMQCCWHDTSNISTGSTCYPKAYPIDYKSFLERFVKRMYDYDDLITGYDDIFTEIEREELARIYIEWAKEVKEDKRK